MSNYKIFISYRRKGGYDTAKLIYDRLRMDGYSVSFDIDTLENGNFGNELEKRIKKCKDFILVLNPGIFDCFSEHGYNPKDDWVRIETALAIKENKNIVPLILEDFTFPKRLPDAIKDISKKNSIDLSPRHFEAAYEKLKSFLLSKPYWKIRHKKRIRSVASVILFALALYLSFAIFTMYMQTKEAKTTADSAVIAKEVEIARLRDSIDVARKAEIAKLKDSIISAKKEEFAAMKDTIAMYKELLKKEDGSAKKTAPQSKKAPATKGAKKAR
ncbi:MAG: toll/interleukin-1 receptor domain-containing protein [Fibromonadaceae bacterium]|jgi:hypothetical protein|nr:toll/interleukin-1 receptor domain-containing protein [Fibromonadaceae bacterium]